MFKINGPTRYLILKQDLASGDRDLSIVERFRKVKSAWSWSARVSPIFPVGGVGQSHADVTDFDPAAKPSSYLYLVGPLAPSRLPLRIIENTISFLSLGLFNFLFFTHERLPCLEEFMERETVNFERWFLNKGVVNEIVREIGSPAKLNPTRKKIKSHPALAAAIKEYELLVATSIERGALFQPTLAEDVVKFDKVLREVIGDLPLQLQQRLLVISNATLSRQTSQTYAGASPVAETECHYWSHSLLGIGIPSMALANTRRYLDSSLGDVNFLGRLKSLSTKDAHSENLEGLAARDAFWQIDHLGGEVVGGETGGDDKGTAAEMVPALTSFSGRDGFRSTQVSLTAPLEVVSGCNSRAWSLLTVTHEIVHDIVAQVSAFMLPRPTDEEKIDQLNAVINDELTPANLLIQFQALFLFSVWRLSGKESEKATRENLQSAIESNWPTFSESLTHCLDYLYFYRTQPEEYIRSLWVSWSTLPSVSSRIRNYLLRCLTALACNNLERDNVSDATFAELKNALERAQQNHPEVQFVANALKILSKEEGELKLRFQDRHLVAKIARYLLYSPMIEKHFWDDPRAGAAGGTSLVFGSDDVFNPLRFLGEHCAHKKPDIRRSAWILYKLAFPAYSDHG